MINDLKTKYLHKKVAVLGAGKEGQAMAKWMLERGAFVTIHDKKTNLEFADRELQSLNIVTGENYLDGLDQYDVIVRSPGIKILEPGIQRAVKAGKEVTSQTEIFLANCPAKVIGVTGTKGKSTTASLTYQILSDGGKKAHLAGNIGETFIDWLEELKEEDLVVLELSSFQLQGLHYSPQIAVVLDVTTEHLDYHATREEYVEAKRFITNNQTPEDWAILLADSETTKDNANHTKAQVRWFSGIREVEQGVGVQDIEGQKWLFSYAGGLSSPLFKLEEAGLPGAHNWGNMAAAVTVALIEGVDIDSIAKTLREFRGLPHRVQEISRAKGRVWVDDAVATAPDATLLS